MPHRQPNWLDRSGGGAGEGRGGEANYQSYGGRVVVCGAGVACEWEGKGVNKCHFSCSKTAQVTGRDSISLLLDPFPIFFHVI